MAVGTATHTRDPHVVADRLRRRGLRATSARIALILDLAELGHATPEQLHAALTTAHSWLNVSTVYRTLESLTDIGLVAHAHLVCQGCGRITALTGQALHRFVTELAANPGFTVTISHLSVQGHCQACRTQPTTGQHRSPRRRRLS